MSIGEYLDAHGYSNVAEWAADSGYVYDKDIDHWVDEDGRLVDIHGQLLGAMESAGIEDATSQMSVTFTLVVDVYASDIQHAEDEARNSLLGDYVPGWVVELFDASVESASTKVKGLDWFPVNEVDA